MKDGVGGMRECRIVIVDMNNLMIFGKRGYWREGRQG